jgi:hypothetical protein
MPLSALAPFPMRGRAVPERGDGLRTPVRPEVSLGLGPMTSTFGFAPGQPPVRDIEHFMRGDEVIAP